MLSQFREQNDSASIDCSPNTPPHSAVPSAAKTGLVQSQHKQQTGPAEAYEAHCVGAVSQKPSLTGTLLKIVETVTENRLYHDFHGFLDGGRSSTSFVTVCFTHTCGDTGVFSCTKKQAQTDMHMSNSTQARSLRDELTALYMECMDVSEKDRIRDILWLKGWLGGCCRCTYSKW